MRRYEQIIAGHAVPPSAPVLPSKAPTCRGVTPGGALNGLLVPRKVSRTSNQRRETRHYDVVKEARVLSSEGEEFAARVINISETGVQLESGMPARIGERVELHFDGFDTVDGCVVWSRGARFGIDFGVPTIDLVPLPDAVSRS